MSNYDLIKYASHALVAGLGITVYDVFIDGRSINESFVMNDAATFAVSNVLVNFSLDVLSGLLPYLNESSAVGMISKHVLQGVIYMMLYNYMLGNKFQYQRDDKNNFYIAVVLSVVLQYVNSPLLSLFGVHHF